MLKGLKSFSGLFMSLFNSGRRDFLCLLVFDLGSSYLTNSYMILSIKRIVYLINKSVKLFLCK